MDIKTANSKLKESFGWSKQFEEQIISLNPDLVIGFSDIQADIAQKLIKRGVTVWINNYRDINGIFKMIGQVGMLVNQIEK